MFDLLLVVKRFFFLFFCLFLFGIFPVFSMAASEEKELGVKDMYTLMLAHKKQITGFELKFESRVYRIHEGGELSKEPVKITQTEYLKSGEMLLLRTSEQVHIGASDEYFLKRLLLMSPKSSRQLIEEDGRVPEGTVSTRYALTGSISSANPISIMGELLQFGVNDIDLSKSTLVYNEKSKLHEMVIGLHSSPKSVMHFKVDLEKGGIPIVSEFNFDGKKSFKYVSEDLRRVDGGMWFPFKSKLYSANSGTVSIVKVARASVNQKIDLGKFYFDFPDGTKVTDDISGLRYRVNKRSGPVIAGQRRFELASSNLSDLKIESSSRLLTKDDLKVSNPATDSDLEGVKLVSSGNEGQAFDIIKYSLLFGILIVVFLGVKLYRGGLSQV